MHKAASDTLRRVSKLSEADKRRLFKEMHNGNQALRRILSQFLDAFYSKPASAEPDDQDLHATLGRFRDQLGSAQEDKQQLLDKIYQTEERHQQLREAKQMLGRRLSFEC